MHAGFSPEFIEGAYHDHYKREGPGTEASSSIVVSIGEGIVARYSDIRHRGKN